MTGNKSSGDSRPNVSTIAVLSFATLVLCGMLPFGLYAYTKWDYLDDHRIIDAIVMIVITLIGFLAIIVSGIYSILFGGATFIFYILALYYMSESISMHEGEMIAIILFPAIIVLPIFGLGLGIAGFNKTMGKKGTLINAGCLLLLAFYFSGAFLG